MAGGVGRGDPAFDIKLAQGHLREASFEELLRIRGGHALELKSDAAAVRTGHAFVEFRQHGRPSGVHPDSTRADWWTTEVLADVFVTQRTDRVRQLARRAWSEPERRRLGVGDNCNDGVLVPVEWYVLPFRAA